ncbi:ABC transporter permease [Streptococcus ovis]|uniref:ABC transporter permease n=1 Tax=Streptococcus ovis TaxID=82806 RepID=UPI00037E3137|nr:ABC transporter permease [Streptococcus ovis]
MTLIKIELMKLKGSWIWLPLLVLPLISVIYGSVNFAGNQSVLQREWLSLWTQVYLFYGMFFFPSLIGVVCAFIWHSEHKHNSLRLLLTSAYTFSQMIWAKVAVAFGLVLLSQVYFLVLYGVSGLLFHFQSAFPLELLFWAFVTSLFALPLVLIQNYLSLRIKSFAPPVALSMLLGVVAFLMGVQNIIPELNYLFASAKMASYINQATSVHLSLSAPVWLRLIGYSIILIILFTHLQKRYLKQLLT